MSGVVNMFLGGHEGTYGDRSNNHDLLVDDDDGTDEDLSDICQELLLKKELTEGRVKSFDDYGALPRYFQDWEESWKKTAGKDGNILHRLLLSCQKEDINRIRHLKDAVVFIVKSYPPLLWANQTKDNHDSPLWLAVKQKEAAMVTAFMQGLKEARQSRLPQLESLLRKPVDPEGRCMLQWAIDKNLEEDAIQAMLVHASDDGLSVQDINGRTPLHAALTYWDCTNDRVQTIQQMIARANNALCITDNLGRSIYAHHLWTQQQWLEGRRLIEEKGKQEEKIVLPEGQSVKDTSIIGPKSTLKTAIGQSPMGSDLKKPKDPQASKQQDDIAEAPKRILANQIDGVYSGNKDPGSYKVEKSSRPNQGSRRDAAPAPSPITTRTPTFDMQDQPNRSIPSRTERDELKKAEQETKARGRGQRGEEKKARAEERARKRKDEQERLKAREAEKRKPEILEANSQLVRLEIKLRCMRMLSPKETARILYGRNLKGEPLADRGEEVGYCTHDDLPFGYRPSDLL
ncbi:hypothetical protein RRF57_005915 [Xylaria bambusicola]|uniref:Uncharacterized protein n=1 Tax=Xylaria bambusicola TaxID=326684 RepID=A0AAN7YY63_9PEZI